MTRPMPALTPHWFHMLLALADSDLHGQGIMQAVLEQSGGRLRLWPGMLYRNLQRLTDEGLIIEVPAPGTPGAGSPRFFRLTVAGRRACAAEADRLSAIVKVAKSKLLLGRG